MENVQTGILLLLSEEESQHKTPENMFHKLVEENFIILKKGVPIKVQEI